MGSRLPQILLQILLLLSVRALIMSRAPFLAQLGLLEVLGFLEGLSSLGELLGLLDRFDCRPVLLFGALWDYFSRHFSSFIYSSELVSMSLYSYLAYWRWVALAYMYLRCLACMIWLQAMYWRVKYSWSFVGPNSLHYITKSQFVLTSSLGKKGEWQNV